jgi:hypothetical protein
VRRYFKAVAGVTALIWAVAFAGSSWAAPPEFGRCVPRAGGKYATSKCTTEVAGKTEFEWEPGPARTTTSRSR